MLSVDNELQAFVETLLLDWSRIWSRRLELGMRLDRFTAPDLVCMRASDGIYIMDILADGLYQGVLRVGVENAATLLDDLHEALAAYRHYRTSPSAPFAMPVSP